MAGQAGEAVAKALTVARPKVRYTVAPDPVQTFMTAHLPRRMVDRMAPDLDGYTLLGSTGEAPSMTTAERMAIAEEALTTAEHLGLTASAERLQALAK